VTARRVVTGYDGSDHARQAVAWAAREAASRGCGLLVVAAVDRTVTGTLPPAGPVLDEQPLWEAVERRLAEIAQDIGDARPDLDVTTTVVQGRAAEALASAAGPTDLVVIGSSGRTALPRMLLGSTAAELVHTGTRPIVVVRGAELANSGRVVLGVDGSPTCERAIDFAFDFAQRHGGELVAVHAWTDLPMDALEPVRVWDSDLDELHRRGVRLLDDALAGPVERYPAVVVRREVSFERPAQALLEHADGAALLVVGSHGRGAVRRLLLGSVSHAMIYHSPCPVAVVRG
jgi:nucleotide-binding universal stress UspA family protein